MRGNINTKLPGSFAPELETLLCCARPTSDRRRTDRLRELLQGHLQWDHLLHMAAFHGMPPLLFLNLKSNCWDLVPPARQSALQSLYDANAGHCRFLASEIIAIVELLKSNGIPAIPYKGASLSKKLYGSLTARVGGDVDVIVAKQDVPAACQLVEQQGYRPALDMTPRCRAAFMRWYYALAFDHPLHKTHLEIHWTIGPEYCRLHLDRVDIWQHLRTEELCNTTVLTLPPHLWLIFLSIHGAKDAWRILKWVCDVAALVLSFTACDWKKALDVASLTGSRRMVHLALRLAEDLLETKIPEEIRHNLPYDRTVEKTCQRICQRIAAHPAGNMNRFSKYTLPLTMCQGFGDRVLCARSFIEFVYLVGMYERRLPDKLFGLCRRMGGADTNSTNIC